MDQRSSVSLVSVFTRCFLIKRYSSKVPSMIIFEIVFQHMNLSILKTSHAHIEEEG